jgi:TonB family protein
MSRPPLALGVATLVLVVAASVVVVHVELPIGPDTAASIDGGGPAPDARPFRGPIRQGRGISPPRKLRHVAAIYPAGAKAAGVRGIVILELTIGPAGRVDEAHVLRSVPGLDQAALDAVRQWEYAPTRFHGEPVSIVVAVTVSFGVD